MEGVQIVKKILCLFMMIFMICGLCGCRERKALKDDVKISLGQVSDNTYRNDFIGISCTLPNDWVFYNKEQLQMLSNFTYDYLDEEFDVQLENIAMFYDMFAEHPETGNRAYVAFEKINQNYFELDILREYSGLIIDTLKPSLEEMGYTDVEGAYKRVSIGKKYYDGIKFFGKFNGQDMYMMEIFLEKGDYRVIICISSMETDEVEEFLEYFSIN